MLTGTKRAIAAALLTFGVGYAARWLPEIGASREKEEYRIPIDPIAFGDLTNDGIDDAIIRVRDCK
ncbi:MAG: hypothetical protein HZB67_03935 [Candidatus Aenigmarchaeota archaeon]|nr:hypothetical protein [Candidatus Aenigmarchaeota archaeon]